MIRKLQRTKRGITEYWSIEVDGRRSRIIFDTEKRKKVLPWTVFSEKRSKNGVDTAETLCILHALKKIEQRLKMGYVDVEKE